MDSQKCLNYVLIAPRIKHHLVNHNVLVLVRKLSSVCYVMKKLSNILNIVTLRIVYFAYFQSLVNYGIIFGGSSSTMHNVFLMQKRIIRIMLGFGPRSPCRGAFRKLDLLTVPSLYSYALMMFVVNNPDSFQSNFTIHFINTRQKINCTYQR